MNSLHVNVMKNLLIIIIIIVIITVNIIVNKC